jgi:hypothetical protein
MLRKKHPVKPAAPAGDVPPRPATLEKIEERLDRMDREIRQRDTELAAALREIRATLKTDLRRVETKVDALSGRLQVLERRRA